jgi:excisionase family DNA binding protein
MDNGNQPLKVAARRLDVSPHTLRAWAIYQRRLPYLRLGRRILFRPCDLDQFEARCRVPAKDSGQ